MLVRAYVRYVGAADAALRPRDDLLFRWAITIDGEIHEFDVSVRVDTASERGVPFPTPWRNAVRCGDLNSRAAEAGRALEAVEDVSDIKCSLIGVPKPCCGPSGDVTSPGAILALCTPSSGFMHFVLVARVEGNLWFCHAGSFGVGEPDLPSRGRLDQADLVVKDIVRGSCGEESQAKRRRIKPHAHPSKLRELIDSSPKDWCTLVALATIKAEHKRAEMHERDADWRAALAGFEGSPWRWQIAEGRASQISVYFLWTWRDALRAGCVHEVTNERLNNLLARGGVPPPDGLHLRDHAMQTGFEAYAEREGRRTGCPFAYLGKPMDGKYQPDPFLWGCVTAEDKLKTMVAFQWLYVTKGPLRKPVIVMLRADQALYHNRQASGWPLRSRSQGIHFSIEWLRVFAEMKKPGTSYHGIAYDNVERPEIVPDLPDGGTDIHAVPLYWDLPCGRNVCFSIFGLRSATEDELAAYDSDDAYITIAREFRFDILGVICDDDNEKWAELRADLGTLADGRWTQLSWRKPDKESVPCWWLTNPHDDDRTHTPKLLSRSLATLRLELEQQRLATTSKILRERAARGEQNARSVAVIYDNEKIWRLVGGPDPEALLAPTAEALALVQETCTSLEKLVEAGPHKLGFGNIRH